ncbi:MAG: hypothetical protein IT439_11865 [Phycisphaerales bacterium]|nr:hypothetical protein [Phycisphaerales bacterium]
MDDHEDDWTEAADSTLERRVLYCQNWRADVVALLAENGRIVERAWYEPYGTPHGMSPADVSGTSDDTNDHYLVPDGDADADDSFVYLDLFGVSAALSDMTGSSDPGDGEYGRPNGTIDSDDYFYYLDVFGTAASLGRNVLSAGHDGATASHGAGNLRNRRGLAGYEWDPHVKRYHVRNRVLYPEVGRWTRRDPMGYVDGMGLYEYVASRAVSGLDATGAFSDSVSMQAPVPACGRGAVGSGTTVALTHPQSQDSSSCGHTSGTCVLPTHVPESSRGGGDGQCYSGDCERLVFSNCTVVWASLTTEGWCCCDDVIRWYANRYACKLVNRLFGGANPTCGTGARCTCSVRHPAKKITLGDHPPFDLNTPIDVDIGCCKISGIIRTVTYDSYLFNGVCPGTSPRP